jgi:hypothetical protein
MIDAACYVSPLPVRIAADYFDKPAGGDWPVERIRHVFVQADGTEILCRPRFCRECFRERRCAS